MYAFMFLGIYRHSEVTSIITSDDGKRSFLQVGCTICTVQNWQSRNSWCAKRHAEEN